MDNFTMSKKELLLIISTALDNAGTFYYQGRIKHFLVYFGRAYALIDLYGCQFGLIEDDAEEIHRIFEQLSVIHSNIRV